MHRFLRIEQIISNLKKDWIYYEWTLNQLNNGGSNMIDIGQHRKALHDIDQKYVNRWSPRAFLNKEVPDNVLHSVFEAARWAPSAANKQPWRYIVAKNKEDHERFLTFINDGNKIWCKKAPVLIAVASRRTWSYGGEGVNPTHAFDTGASWGYLALEANRQGLITHGMGGFDREKAKEVLNIPEEFDVHAIVALGYYGGHDQLSEELQEREKPSGRNEIDTFVSEGLFDKTKEE